MTALEDDADCRIVTCAVPAPECHWTVDCFADDKSDNPCFPTHPGYLTDKDTQQGMLMLTMLKKSVLTSAQQPESERSLRVPGCSQSGH